MPTLGANVSSPLILNPGLALTLIIPALATARLIELDTNSLPMSPVNYTVSPTVLGPFATLKVYRLDAVNGSITYSTGIKDERFQERRVLAQSGVAVVAPLDTVENVLATVTIPGGTMGPNGSLRVLCLFSHLNSINVKTLRVRLNGIGGTVYAAVIGTSLLQSRFLVQLFNRGVQDSQVGGDAADVEGLGSSTAALVTSTIDTSLDRTLVLTAQKATGAEAVTLEAYSVEVTPGFV